MILVCLIGDLAETSAPLDHLDLVTVGVRDEEEARQRLAFVFEVAQWSGREALALEADMFGIDVVDDDSEMPVAVTERIGVLAVEIDRQLDLEGRGGVAQINQREIGELDVVGDLETEGAFVKIQRPRFVEDADHGMDWLCHQSKSFQIG